MGILERKSVIEPVAAPSLTILGLLISSLFSSHGDTRFFILISHGDSFPYIDPHNYCIKIVIYLENHN